MHNASVLSESEVVKWNGWAVLVPHEPLLHAGSQWIRFLLCP